MKHQFWLTYLALIVAFVSQLLLFDYLCPVLRDSWGLTLMYDATSAFVLSTMIMLPRRRWIRLALATLLCIIVDAWLICNYMYFQANGLFITWQVAQLAHQLGSVGSSLQSCWSWSLLLLPAISIGTLMGLSFLRPKHSHPTIIGMLTGALLVYALSGIVRFHTKMHPAPFSAVWFSPIDIPDSEKSGVWATDYDKIVFLQKHSIATYLMRFIYDAVVPPRPVSVSPADEATIRRLISPMSAPSAPEGHLIYILVESMEGWILEAKDLDGCPICPHIVHWMEYHPTLFCPAVKSQKMYGESGDGQLICLTGLLPIDDGAACNTYGANTYPNFAHFYTRSAIINPTPYMWNQDITTYSYGFRELIQPAKETPLWNDSIVMDQARAFLSQSDDFACVLLLTIDSHMPFTQQQLPVALPDSITGQHRDYIQTFRHVDAQIGRFLDWFATTPAAATSTVVITGDHYAMAGGFPHCRPYVCPVVMSSPTITSDIRPEEMYQMDLYTTLLPAIRQQGYFWQGFGANYLDTCPVPRAAVEDAMNLSNKMIRTNYFAR